MGESEGRATCYPVADRLKHRKPDLPFPPKAKGQESASRFFPCLPSIINRCYNYTAGNPGEPLAFAQPRSNQTHARLSSRA